jgi:tripartite-type tricarboxylate transporter receptor subunit TctC
MTYPTRAFLLLELIVISLPAAAQKYPDHPIQLISPNPVGGASDTITRIISMKMAELSKGTIVIDNRGAG